MPALGVTACVVTDNGNADLPSEAVVVRVDLKAGAARTYEFEVEAETGGDMEGFRVFMEPSPEVLEGAGIRVEQTWVENGVTEEGWPDGRVLVQADRPVSASLILTLANRTESPISDDITVTVEASPVNVPGPSEADLRLGISQR
jgi:hypothetical protein